MKGPFTGLGRPPQNRDGKIDPFEFSKWLDKIWLILSGLPGIGWSIIDKTGSKLSDLEQRTHTMLQHVFGADVTNTGQVIEDEDHVKHVADGQAQGWETARYDAANAMALEAMAVAPPSTRDVDTARHDAANALAVAEMMSTYCTEPRGDMQALNWMV